MSTFRKKVVRRAAGAVIDTLENRRLLSTVSLVPQPDGTNELKITGTSGKDNVYVFDDPINNFVEVVDDKNGNGIAEGSEVHLFPNSNLSIIHADMKGGDDRLEIHGITSYEAKDRSFEIDMGDGNDTFLFTTDPAKDVPLGLDSDSLGGDISDGSDFNFNIHGDAGNDKLTVDFTRTSIVASAVTVQIDASSGNDTVNLNLPNSDSLEAIGEFIRPDDVTQPDVILLPGADVIVDIDLGGGNDTLNQDVNTEIFNRSDVSINVLGQTGKDVYNDYEDFSLEDNSSLTVNADLGSGDDRYHGEFNFNSVGVQQASQVQPAELPIVGQGINIDESSQANFILHGSDGNDKLEVDHLDETAIGSIGLQQPARIDGLMNVQLYGGDGNDLAEIDLNPGPSVDLGLTGLFRGVVSGDNGNDHTRIDILAGGEGGTWDLTENGGIGNDSLGAAFQDESQFGVNYGPRGGILVDGGSGTDKWDTEGNGNFKLRSDETLDESLEQPFI
jgi:hypothetical protein